MTKTNHGALALAAVLAGCGDHTTASATASTSPSQTLATIVQAYSDNAIQAKRTWAGKPVVVAGKFFSAGKTVDGVSILLSAGALVGLGELRLRGQQDAFVAKLKKDDEVTMRCTVDPENDTQGTTLIDCVPT